MSPPRFGVTRPVPVNLLMIALLLAGAVAGLTLRRQFFPEVDPESASIAMPFPGATPEEIEETLARKVEDRIADLDEVDEIITTLSEGGGGVVVRFKEGVGDVSEATDEIERAVDSLMDLPEDAEAIQVTEIEARLPVIMLSFYGDVTEEVLKQTIREARDDLETLPGMGEIVISGVRDYEVRVDVRTEALLEHRISLPQVAEAIRAWMREVPGGSVRGSSGNVNIRTLGVAERAEAIRNIVVRGTAEGQVLRVGDLARVEESFVDTQLFTRFNGKPSASLTVYKVGEQDIIKIAEMVRAYIEGREGQPLQKTVIEQLMQFGVDVSNAMARLSGRDPMSDPKTPRIDAHELGVAASLPPGVQIAPHSDLARFVEGRLSLLTRNALQGGVLVFATLLLFLNWRVALWVGIGLTTAFAGTLVVMWWLGITLNLLTMFGMIVVLGLLVDDAIVVAENIQARHDRNEPSLVAAVRGAEQVFWPVVATVLTSIVAFLPLTWVRGSIGDLLGALPVVVACALFMSLVESLLILPSHMGHSLVHRDRREPRRIGRLIGRYEAWRDRMIFQRLVPAFGRVLNLALHYRYISISIAIATLTISVGWLVGGRVIFEFLPSSDSETIVVDVRMPIGTPVERTREVVGLLDDAARSQSEVKTINSVVGLRVDVDTSQIDAAATHLAQMFIELYSVESRDRESSQVIAAIRDRAGPIDDAERVSYSEITGGPGGASITMRARGSDNAQRHAAVLRLKQELGRFEGVHDISDDDALGQRELQITLKPGAGALGFTVADVASQVRGALFGIDAHVFSDRREDIDVRVRLDEATRRSLTAIENLWVISPSGSPVPLREIAQITDGAAYATVRRVDRQRATTVTAATAPGLSPEDIVRDFPLDEVRGAYPDVEITLGGRQEQMIEAFGSLPLGFGAALIMIYVILAWLFGSYTQPLAVMLAIPFGVIGVIWGHVFLGYKLTFLSMIGFVALSGIVVNDSLILTDFYNKKRKEGLPLREALVEAGKQRLRPISLTTLTTVLGLTPLMLEQSFQAKFLIPMAISIAFGLAAATVLILMVLPCIIVIIDDLKGVVHYLWHGQRRSERKPATPAEALLSGDSG